MSDENWLIEAFNAGKLDKIIEQSERDYAEGRALDTLYPPPTEEGSQPVSRSAPSPGSAAPCENHWWPGAAHGERDKCPKCGWTCQYYGDGFGGANKGSWVATEPPNEKLTCSGPSVGASPQNEVGGKT